VRGTSKFARDADEPSVRVRMMAVAQALGWLTPAELRAETVRMFGERLAGDAVSASDVNLACALNGDGALGRETGALRVSAAQAAKVPHAAVLGVPRKHRRSCPRAARA
jgi:hypothetical protein